MSPCNDCRIVSRMPSTPMGDEWHRDLGRTDAGEMAEVASARARSQPPHGWARRATDCRLGTVTDVGLGTGSDPSNWGIHDRW